MIEFILLILNEGLYYAGYNKYLDTNEGCFTLGKTDLLSKKDGLSQEKLAERLDIDKAAVSRTVNALYFKGYIHRERLAYDSRAYRVTLTDSAKEAGEKIKHAYNKVYETALRGIDESEFQCFNNLLEKVYKNLTS